MLKVSGPDRTLLDDLLASGLEHKSMWQKWVNPVRLTSVHEAFTQEEQAHRRRLVVEVALGVVDASAVALLDHVISDVESNCDASVPVFNPLDSDEEEVGCTLKERCDPGGS